MRAPLAGVVSGSLLGTALLIAPPAFADPPASDTDLSLDPVCEALLRLAPDPSRVAEVSSLLIERDAGVFALESGWVAFAKPVGGRTRALMFQGKGRFLLNPAQAVERDQLQRLFKQPNFTRSFESLLILFADSTEADLTAQLKFGSGDLHGTNLDVPRFLEDYVEKKDHQVNRSLARTLLEDRRNGLFVATFNGDAGRLRFEIDPYRTEQVALYKLSTGPSPIEVLSQFPLGAASCDTLGSDVVPVVGVRSYALDIDIPSNLKPVYRADLQCEAMQDSTRFLDFMILSADGVDSVRMGPDGPPLRFATSPGILWIDAGRTLQRGETFRLRVHYRGEALVAKNEARSLPLSFGWYPFHDPRNRATFDLTFHYPRGFQLASVGDVVSRSNQGSRLHSVWRVSRPARNASYQLGRFQEYKTHGDSMQITVLIDRTAHASVARDLIEEGVGSGRNMEQQVAADIQRSMKFFSHVYGPIERRDFHAVDGWTEHSEAFPGLITLGWRTFQATDRSGEDESLRAHEVAHQWWPMEVEYRTYRDRWLSEGLAEFSGLWYMHVSRGRSDLYAQALSYRREQIMAHRDAGSTWLGHRVITSRTPGSDYAVAVYYKGAWVFHMLRNYFIDLRTMDEARFVELMRDFHRTYRGGTASTADFSRLLGKHAGEDMDWFIRQWIHGTAIPEYRVAWASDLNSEGRNVLRLRVEQSKVPNGFKMPVMVRIELENGQKARARIWVDAPKVEKEIVLDGKVKKIEFNDLSSVLCSVDYATY